MQVVKYVIMAILFAILSPGVLIWLPTGASRRVAALVHGIVFAVVWYFVHEFAESIEGYEDKKKKQ